MPEESHHSADYNILHYWHFGKFHVDCYSSLHRLTSSPQTLKQQDLQLKLQKMVLKKQVNRFGQRQNKNALHHH